MRIVVTGATGSLGTALMYRLRDQNHSLLGLGLSEAKLKSLSDEGFEMKRCDIGDLATLTEYVADCDVVIHCALHHNLPHIQLMLLSLQYRNVSFQILHLIMI